ncbi:MAG TPA: hypothetical protein VN081_05350 [Dongiaceae bacterium]|nr:hypothetical protein [Dongiaceae bacterium]
MTLVASAIAVGAALAIPAAANATGNPSSLDQGDLSLACQEQYNASGWLAQLYGTTAYSWKCVYNGNTSDKRNVDVNAYCMTHWGVWAQTTNPNSPYSWKCQGY